MDYIIGFITLFFSVLGIATIIRYIVWKITDSNKNQFHYLIFLKDNSAEIAIRGIIERDHFDIHSGDRKLYAIDLGLEESVASACKKLSEDYSQIIFCDPCELVDYLKN